uniref:Putative secreted protein n=1 Tax=Desmodus rotundus TaxID=9430 RepID=K9IFW7_DESRO
MSFLLLVTVLQFFSLQSLSVPGQLETQKPFYCTCTRPWFFSANPKSLLAPRCSHVVLPFHIIISKLLLCLHTPHFLWVTTSAPS